MPSKQKDKPMMLFSIQCLVMTSWAAYFHVTSESKSPQHFITSLFCPAEEAA